MSTTAVIARIMVIFISTIIITFAIQNRKD